MDDPSTSTAVSTRTRLLRFSSPSPSHSSSPIGRPLTNDQTSPLHDLSEGETSISEGGTISETDDEDGVFFGEFDPIESGLVAKLSHNATSASPSSPHIISTPSKPIPARRVSKRDSREFLRRKTLLISSVHNDEEVVVTPGSNKGKEKEKVQEKEKTWPGGFYELREGAHIPQELEESPTSETFSPNRFKTIGEVAIPSKTPSRTETCDLTLDFANFRVSDIVSPAPARNLKAVEEAQLEQDNEDDGDETSSEEDEEEEDVEEEVETSTECSDVNSEDDESDKENVEVPYTGPTDEEDTIGPVVESTIVVGFERYSDEQDDVIGELDMGGLRLSDFADPEVDAEPVETVGGDTLDYEDDSEGGYSLDRYLSEEVVNEIADMLLGKCLNESLSSEGEGSEDPADTAGDNSRNSECDSPLPIARAGPVVIPVFAHTIQAESDSPYRDIPTDLDIQLVTEAEDIFKESGISPTRTSQSLTPTSKSTTASNDSTPSTRKPSLPGIGRTNKVLKSSQAGGILQASVDRQRTVSGGYDKSTALAVRSQLDATFAKPSLMGPPQRTVSSSSASSSGSSGSAGVSRFGTSRGPTSNSTKTFCNSKARPATIAEGGPATAGPSRLPARSAAPTSTPQSASQSSIQRPMKSITGVRPINSTLAQAASKGIPKAAIKASTTTAPARPVLQPRSALHFSRPASTSQPAVKTRPQTHASAPTKALSIVAGNAPVEAAAPISQASNPLKRPFAMAQSTARSAVSVSSGMTGGNIMPPPARSALGMPQRLVQSAQGMHFSMGVGGGEATYRGFTGATRSPARLSNKRPLGGTPSRSSAYVLGTPSRMIGTPGRMTPQKSRPPVLQFSINTVAPTISQASVQISPAKDVSAVEPSATSGPPATATRQASEATSGGGGGLATSDDVQRGSSEDHEEVSLLLPSGSSPLDSSSPTKSAKSTKAPTPGKDKFVRSSPIDEDNEEEEELPAKPAPASRLPKASSRAASTTSSLDRPKRAPKPREIAQPKPVKAASRGPAAATNSIVPNMSEKELRATTQMNTQKNQVYLCAIDRQIIRKNGPRPPSPTSKIRTTIDREDEEKKKGRGDRAKRRAGGDTSVSPMKDIPPVIETVWVTKGPGEEEDYVSPERAVKKIKTAHHSSGGGRSAMNSPSSGRSKSLNGVEKTVKWDRGLVIIRDNGDIVERKTEGRNVSSRSALRGEQIQLDNLGNLVETGRPHEKLKSHKVVVQAVFYDGEEPAPFSYASSAGTTPATTKSKKK